MQYHTLHSLVEVIVSDKCLLRQSFLVIIFLEFSHYHWNGTPVQGNQLNSNRNSITNQNKQSICIVFDNFQKKKLPKDSLCEEKLSIPAPLDGAHGMSLPSKVNDAIAQGLPPFISHHNSTLHFSEHAKGILQELVRDHWVEVAHFDRAAASSKSHLDVTSFEHAAIESCYSSLCLTTVGL